MNSIANSDEIGLVFDVDYFQIFQDVYNSNTEAGIFMASCNVSL